MIHSPIVCHCAITPLPFAHFLPGPNPGPLTGESCEECVGVMVADGHQVSRSPVPQDSVGWCVALAELTRFLPGLLLRIVLVTTFILGKISPPSGAV